MARSLALAARMLPVLINVLSLLAKVMGPPFWRLIVPAFTRLVRLLPRLPARSKVAPEATVSALVAREPVRVKVPAFTLVPPVWVLAPESVSLAAPDLLKEPAPEMIPA